MPNWSFQSTAFYSKNKAELERLIGDILYSISPSAPLLAKYFGKGWLGNVLDHTQVGTTDQILNDKHGEIFKQNNIEPVRPGDVINYRGEIYGVTDFSYDARKDEWYFYVKHNQAWYDAEYVWDLVLLRYKDIKYVFICDEEGSDEGYTTDKDGRFFDTKYAVNLELYQEDFPIEGYQIKNNMLETDYIASSDEVTLINEFNRITGLNIKNMDELYKFQELMNDSNNSYINIIQYYYKDPIELKKLHSNVYNFFNNCMPGI